MSSRKDHQFENEKICQSTSLISHGYSHQAEHKKLPLPFTELTESLQVLPLPSSFLDCYQSSKSYSRKLFIRVTLVFKLKSQIFHQSFLLATIKVRYLINNLLEALLQVMALAVLTEHTAVVPFFGKQHQKRTKQHSI